MQRLFNITIALLFGQLAPGATMILREIPSVIPRPLAGAGRPICAA